MSTSHFKSPSRSTETLVYLYQSTPRPIPGDGGVRRRDRVKHEPVDRVRSGIGRQCVILRKLM